jgi:hypothetical protein
LGGFDKQRGVGDIDRAIPADVQHPRIPDAAGQLERGLREAGSSGWQNQSGVLGFGQLIGVIDPELWLGGFDKQRGVGDIDRAIIREAGSSGWQNQSGASAGL